MSDNVQMTSPQPSPKDMVTCDAPPFHSHWEYEMGKSVLEIMSSRRHREKLSDREEKEYLELRKRIVAHGGY